ncbi:MAG: acetolactate synthase [Phycisphaerae bacterium]|nr:MAG: acetolactate synthase [Phycisphaerae bacterium]
MPNQSEQTQMRTGSRVVIDALEQAGVSVAFGYPGGAIMPLYDELLDAKFKNILTRHEQGAIHAADGYARATNKVGVCIATSGPGATNLVTGICTAQMDSSPVLCLTGQVPSQLIGTDGFQEADVLGVVTSITKQAYLVRSVDDLPRVMAEALFICMSGRPGPVVVDIPKDVLIATTAATCEPITELPGYIPTPKLDATLLPKAHELLKASKQPVCIVGGGCRLSHATDRFRQWCDKTQVPVITTLMGLGSTDPDYAGWLGMPGMHGLRRANMAIVNCDLIVALGIRFDDRVTGKLAVFAPDARIVHVDIDEAELSKLVKVDVPINADLNEALVVWNKLLDEDPVQSFKSWQKEAMDVGDGLKPNYAHDADNIPPTALLDEVLSMIGPDAIVTTDVGQHQMWTAQRVRLNDPKKWITSGGAGTMGYGVPSAMGAQMACPDQRVLAVCGDGGFQMTMAEMATIARCKLPLKILIMDNKFLGMVRQWQELFFDNRYSAVDLSDNPDFAALARVYGLQAFTLDHVDEMSSTLDAWWNCEGPALLHAVCHLEENVFPMVPAGAGLGDMVESA